MPPAEKAAALPRRLKIAVVLLLAAAAGLILLAGGKLLYSDRKMLDALIEDGRVSLENEDSLKLSSLLSEDFTDPETLLEDMDALFRLQDNTRIRIVRRDLALKGGRGELDITVLVSAQMENIGEQLGRASAVITFRKDRVRGYGGWRVLSARYADETDFIRKDLSGGHN